ncbi:Small subunit processome complex component [Orobanche minor]
MLFHPNLLASISLTHEDRWLLFPPGTPFHDPPPPPPPSPPPPPLVLHRPSRLHSQSSSELNIVPHPLIPGVYVSNHGNCDGNTTLYTKNLVPGVQSLHNYDDVVVSVQDEDGTTVEYREWSPFESKLAASILSGAKNIWIKPGSRVLVLFSRDDEQFGITISHLSDIVGPARKHGHVKAHMAQSNAMYFLKAGGHYMVYVQANILNQQTGLQTGVYTGVIVFDCWCKRTQVQFKRMEQVFLEPFDRDHAYVSGVFRTLEVADIDNIDPRCLVSSKFWTSQDSNRGDGRRLTLYEKQKCSLTTKLKGDEHCYSFALPDPFMADDLFTDYKIACSSSPFHEEIIRGVRKNIDKFFRNMKPGDLEKAQLDLARAYCRQKLISPEKGKSQKKRGAFQASIKRIVELFESVSVVLGEFASQKTPDCSKLVVL